MPRYEVGIAQKGSQMWLQRLINEQSTVLNDEICKTIPGIKPNDIEWLSPIQEDNFSEYRDKAFLDRLNINLEKVRLKEFWPRGGPVWDGLGKAKDNVILLEAKAHIPELNSSPIKASQDSSMKISNSLQQVKEYLGSKTDVDWTDCFYQYTNRFAHLYLLRTLNNISAWLFNICFVGDIEMNGPQSEYEWIGANRMVRSHLGLGKHPLKDFEKPLFFDVRKLF